MKVNPHDAARAYLKSRGLKFTYVLEDHLLAFYQNEEEFDTIFEISAENPVELRGYKFGCSCTLFSAPQSIYESIYEENPSHIFLLKKNVSDNKQCQMSTFDVLVPNNKPKWENPYSPELLDALRNEKNYVIKSDSIMFFDGLPKVDLSSFERSNVDKLHGDLNSFIAEHNLMPFKDFPDSFYVAMFYLNNTEKELIEKYILDHQTQFDDCGYHSNIYYAFVFYKYDNDEAEYCDEARTLDRKQLNSFKGYPLRRILLDRGIPNNMINAGSPDWCVPKFIQEDLENIPHLYSIVCFKEEPFSFPSHHDHYLELDCDDEEFIRLKLKYEISRSKNLTPL